MSYLPLDIDLLTSPKSGSSSLSGSTTGNSGSIGSENNVRVGREKNSQESGANDDALLYEPNTKRAKLK